MSAKRKASSKKAPPSKRGKAAAAPQASSSPWVDSSSRRIAGLYDNTGRELLAEASRTLGAKVRVLGHWFTLQMADGDQKLVLTRIKSTDDRDDRCRAKLDQRAHELAAREKDLAITRKQVLDKMEDMSQCHDNENEFKRLNGELATLI